jgi:hypothetical protein
MWRILKVCKTGDRKVLMNQLAFMSQFLSTCILFLCCFCVLLDRTDI